MYDHFSGGGLVVIGHLTHHNTAVDAHKLSSHIRYTVGQKANHFSSRVEDLNTADIIGNCIDASDQQRSELIKNCRSKYWCYQLYKRRNCNLCDFDNI